MKVRDIYPKPMKETDWHHAPLHRFVPGAVHMITGATFEKQRLFHDAKRLDLFLDTLMTHFLEAGWIFHAWACLSNHYHVLAAAPEQGDLSNFLRTFHSQLGLALNNMEAISKRQVMYQFWDRAITHESSYYARLKYVMNNPVHHGLVKNARQYRWCSADWFHRNNASSFRRRVMSYGTDRINEPDDF